MTNESEEQPSSAIGRTIEYAFERYQAEDWERLFQAITELMIKTKTAERRIGNQSESIETISSSLFIWCNEFMKRFRIL